MSTINNVRILIKNSKKVHKNIMMNMHWKALYSMIFCLNGRIKKMNKLIILSISDKNIAFNC